MNMTAAQKHDYAYRQYAAFIQRAFQPQAVCTSPEQGTLLREPCVLIANHQIFADTPLILTALQGNDISFLAAQKLFKIPVVGTFLTNMNAIKIKQNAPQTAWLKTAAARLAEGASVLIYPEGHKNFDGNISEFQPGFLLLAAMAKVPVLPLFITQQYRPYTQPTQLFVGKPVHLHDPVLNAEYIQQQTKAMQQAMFGLREYANNYRKADDNWIITSNQY